jgi:hypothetical protein
MRRSDHRFLPRAVCKLLPLAYSLCWTLDVVEDGGAAGPRRDWISCRISLGPTGAPAPRIRGKQPALARQSGCVPPPPRGEEAGHVTQPRVSSRGTCIQTFAAILHITASISDMPRVLERARVVVVVERSEGPRCGTWSPPQSTTTTSRGVHNPPHLLHLWQRDHPPSSPRERRPTPGIRSGKTTRLFLFVRYGSFPPRPPLTAVRDRLPRVVH